MGPQLVDKVIVKMAFIATELEVEETRYNRHRSVLGPSRMVGDA